MGVYDGNSSLKEGQRNYRLMSSESISIFLSLDLWCTSMERDTGKIGGGCGDLLASLSSAHTHSRC
jgi:hypothetical protein